MNDPRIENILAVMEQIALEMLDPVESLGIGEGGIDDKVKKTVSDVILPLLEIAEKGPDCEAAQSMRQKLQEAVARKPELRAQAAVGCRALFGQVPEPSQQSLPFNQPPPVSFHDYFKYPRAVTLWPPPIWLMDDDYEDD